jgi:hypothetical protein
VSENQMIIPLLAVNAAQKFLPIITGHELGVGRSVILQLRFKDYQAGGGRG